MWPVAYLGSQGSTPTRFISLIFTASKRSCGNIMFSVVCVSVALRGGGWERGAGQGPRPSIHPACRVLPLTQRPLKDMFKLADYVSRTALKWTVGIRLKCLIVKEVIFTKIGRLIHGRLFGPRLDKLSISATVC